MSRLNFRIVEVSESEHNYDSFYEDFKEDFLNPHVTVDDLISKYNIPPYIYKRWSKMIKEEYGLGKKPCYTHSSRNMSLYLKKNSYIYPLTNSYGIRKKLDGEMKYFGKYKDIETARMVRDKLYESNWDKKLAEELIKEYGYVKPVGLKPDELMPKYEEFKHLYLDVPTKYEDIMEKLDVNCHGYNWLVHRLREDYPDAKKNRMRCYGNKKPKKKSIGKIKSRPMRYIHKQPNGKYIIRKVINGREYTFGTYKNLYSAKRKRNKLEANGWVLV